MDTQINAAEDNIDFRQLGDDPADKFIQSIFAEPETKKELYGHLQSLRLNSDIEHFLSLYPEVSFIRSAAQLPDWADPKLMKQGASFFAAHAQSIMNLLGLLSLPYCYTAANGAFVLALSGRMDTDTGKRLYETGEFVWDVMAPDAFEVRGKGFASILKIRMMHAAARYYTSKSESWEAGFGVPVNQEDMAGTNLSFSILVVRGLRKFGYVIPYSEQQAFLHLWNVIGHLLGVDQRLLPEDGKQALNIEKSIKKSQFRPSAHGQALTEKLIRYFIKVTPNVSSKTEVSQLMRYLLEDDVADMLGIIDSKLPDLKLSLLRNLNFIKDFKFIRNSSRLYQEEFQQFKQNNPMLKR
jgi:hypothetical protein